MICDCCVVLDCNRTVMEGVGMAVAPYKLSCVLLGHSVDVRSVAVTHEGGIVSGSRDKCAKIWKPNG